MKQSLWNPYLPLKEYIPDGEPHVFDGRVYIFGSHDMGHGTEFCPLDYKVWSAPVEDLSDWKCEGVIYRKEQDPANRDGSHRLYAPDVVRGSDGRYYLYYGLDLMPQISVAVCDTPAGAYQYLGIVHDSDGNILEKNMPYDPAVINEEGRIYLYYGFAPHFPMHGKQEINCPGCSVVELQEDMLTIKEEPKIILPAKKWARGTPFSGHAFFEAASIRRVKDLYYLVYASELGHELCYAKSSSPDRDFEFGGIIISNGDIGYGGRTEKESVWSAGNNHGGMVQIEGQWYIFYHRHTHGTMYSRQGCAERIEISEDGKIHQVEMTSMGLNPCPFPAKGCYPAAIACHLTGKHGTKSPIYGKVLRDVPIVSSEDGDTYLSQIEEGTQIGYKYFFFEGKHRLALTYRGGGGSFLVKITKRTNEVLTEIPLTPVNDWQMAEAVFQTEGKRPLYLEYTGEGTAELKTLKFD